MVTRDEDQDNIEVITIKDEPQDPPEECFNSAGRYWDCSDNIYPRSNDLFTNTSTNSCQGSSGINQNSKDGESSLDNQNNRHNHNDSSNSNPGNSKSETDQAAATPTTTQTNTPTVFKSYSLASIPKFGEDGRVLTLGQRLALIQKKQEEEKINNAGTAPGPSSITKSQGDTTPSSSVSRSSAHPRGGPALSPNTSHTSHTSPSSHSSHSTNSTNSAAPARDRLNVYSGLRYNIAMKVLVTEEINTVMNQRGKDYYMKDGLRALRFTKTLYPVYNECQIYLKGSPKQVLECLYTISEDLRKHFDRRRNSKGKAREETMLLVMPVMITSELLRYRKRKRVIQHVEESNGVWIQLDEGTVEGECVISVTGHRQQMRDGLRQLLEELVVSPHAETLPSLFYYIPSPRHRQHGTYHGTQGTLHGTHGTCSDTGQYHDMNSVERVSPAWLACDRPQYHHWMTFRDYKF